MVEELINNLHSKDSKLAYNNTLELVKLSEEGTEVYKYMDLFIDMISDENSYVRNRGLMLVAYNAKNDIDNKIDEVIDEYLKHILDVKPITARQCIKLLPTIAKYKKDLIDDILLTLKKADVSIYKDSMSGLIYKDIVNAIKIIEKL